MKGITFFAVLFWLIGITTLTEIFLKLPSKSNYQYACGAILALCYYITFTAVFNRIKE
jgi:hypothetical protein